MQDRRSAIAAASFRPPFAARCVAAPTLDRPISAMRMPVPVRPHLIQPTRIVLDTHFLLESHDYVIVLGESLVEVYVNLDISLPWIGGMIAKRPDTDIAIDAISINVDPSLIFQSLSVLNPAIETVFTVATSAIDQAFIEQSIEKWVRLDHQVESAPARLRHVKKPPSQDQHQ